MNRKIISILVAAPIAALALLAAFSAEPESVEYEPPHVDVAMPNKSSRPGCQENDACYVPSVIVIQRGDSVVWQNQDVAFHSVTSGMYDAPKDLFDSGHMGPDDLYEVSFDEAGMYDYFCTLHPWMRGSVTVNE